MSCSYLDNIILASPTMHGEEMQYVQETYETNWMSTVGTNINEVEKFVAEKVGLDESFVELVEQRVIRNGLSGRANEENNSNIYNVVSGGKKNAILNNWIFFLRNKVFLPPKAFANNPIYMFKGKYQYPIMFSWCKHIYRGISKIRKENIKVKYIVPNKKVYSERELYLKQWEISDRI